MKAACAIFVALVCCSVAQEVFIFGIEESSDVLLRTTTIDIVFNNVSKFLHINNCHEYSHTISKIELFTRHGQIGTAALISGGPGDYKVVIEICGIDTATIEVKLWGVHALNPSKKDFQIYSRPLECGETDDY